MRSYTIIIAALSIVSCSKEADPQLYPPLDQQAWPERDQQVFPQGEQQPEVDQQPLPADGGPSPNAPIQTGVASTGSGVDVDTITWEHTIPGNTEGGRLLLVMTGVRGDAEVTSVKYGAEQADPPIPGQDLTFLRKDRTTVPDARTEIWYLVDPPTGTKSIVIVWNKKENVTGGATSWVGVDTADPFVGTGAGKVINEPTTDPTISLDVPSESGARVVDVITVQTPDAKLDVDSGQTELWTLSGEHLETHCSSKTGEGSQTQMKWTQTGTGISEKYEPYAISAVSIRSH